MLYSNLQHYPSLSRRCFLVQNSYVKSLSQLYPTMLNSIKMLDEKLIYRNYYEYAGALFFTSCIIFKVFYTDTHRTITIVLTLLLPLFFLLFAYGERFFDGDQEDWHNLLTWEKPSEVQRNELKQALKRDGNQKIKDVGGLLKMYKVLNGWSQMGKLYLTPECLILVENGLTMG